MATLEQQRAQFALERIEEIKEHPSEAKYKTQLLKLPARLHTSGLGQTVAFYLASGQGSPEARICDWLGRWLKASEVYAGISDDEPLIRWLTGSASGLSGDERLAETRYRQASAEARALAVWLKRFAEAFLGEPAKAPAEDANEEGSEPGERPA